MDPEAQNEPGETPFREALRMETGGLLLMALAIVVSRIAHRGISRSASRSGDFDFHGPGRSTP
jgi:hypothetical protein